MGTGLGGLSLLHRDWDSQGLFCALLPLALLLFVLFRHRSEKAEVCLITSIAVSCSVLLRESVEEVRNWESSDVQDVSSAGLRPGVL